MNWPDFNDDGDLPVGIYQAALQDVIDHFGKGGLKRFIISQRLKRIHEATTGTGFVARFIIFGSFVSNKPAPGDIDIFLVMDDSFDVSELSGETAIFFDHMATHNYEGASIFWVRGAAALGGVQAAVEHWQLKRDGKRRGIVEVVSDDKK